MIQAFTGTFDSLGIRSLRPESEQTVPSFQEFGVARFWAVLESNDLEAIRLALAAGERTRALKLISDFALSIGTIVPD